MQFRRAHNLTVSAVRGIARASARVRPRAPTCSMACSRCARPTSSAEQGVFQLFARVAYPVNDDIRAALKDGLMLTFDLDVVVSRERRFWMDETVAEYTLRRELLYHAVSDRYVTRDVDSRNQRAAQLRHTGRSARGARHRGCLAVPAVAAALGQPPVPRVAARRRAPRPSVRHLARAAVLDRRLAPRKRVVLMVPAALRRLGTLGLIALWVLVSGGLLLLLALSVQNSVQFSRLQAWILLANVIALVAVSVLLARKIIELVRAFRAQVPGSRLTARTVAIFGSLVVAPLIIVYLFSLEFLNRASTAGSRSRSSRA